MIVEGQIEGAVALGIGSALLEEVRYDGEGQPLAGTFMDYAMPRSLDVPQIQIEHLETLSPSTRSGSKGWASRGRSPWLPCSLPPSRTR